MSVGGVFILILVLIVLGVLGGGLYLLSMWLHGKKLAPGGDETRHPAEMDAAGRPTQVDAAGRPMPGGEAGEIEEGQEDRPEHVRVESEQHARFTGSR